MYSSSLLRNGLLRKCLVTKYFPRVWLSQQTCLMALATLRQGVSGPATVCTPYMQVSAVAAERKRTLHGRREHRARADASGTVAVYRNVVLKSSSPWFWYEHSSSSQRFVIVVFVLLFYCVCPLLVIFKWGCNMVLSLSEWTRSRQHVAIPRWEVGEQSPIFTSTSHKLPSRWFCQGLQY